jgi:phenylpropionate dioxygenase-like ring-hydroxylating dioxygenase large terminal subunit
MGAQLSRQGRVEEGRLACPWHDLRLGPEGHGAWRPFPTRDDGVLTWISLPTENPTDAPLLPKRPDGAVTAVVERAGRCEVRDVIENRLDPWHGRYLHPYAFADLVVVDEDDSGVVVEVDYRIAGRLTVRVTARFEAPEAATVRMVILEGTGAGSVVETHATQESPERCRVVEALFATSEGSDLSGRWFAPGMARFLARVARRLWLDDISYAERRYALRRGEVPGWAGS